jgi:hypothetical protein
MMRFDNWRRENYRASNLKRQDLPNTMKICPRETGDCAPGQSLEGPFHWKWGSSYFCI